MRYLLWQLVFVMSFICFVTSFVFGWATMAMSIVWLVCYMVSGYKLLTQ